MIVRRALGALAVLMVFSACSTANSGGPAISPRDLLLDTPGKGYKSTLDTTLSVTSASAVMPTDPTRTRSQLAAFGYSNGAERVWTKGDEYVSAIAFEFNSPVGPGNTLAFLRTELKARAAVTLFDDNDVPSGQGFDLYGVSRSGNNQVFCQGALFPLDRYLLQVEDCAAGPRYAAGPLQLTRTQYERDARLLGLSVSAPKTPAG